MQLSFHADYACRVLIYLAALPNEQSSIREIAEAFGVSQSHLVKVVHRLGRLGFIETTRGRGGGIRLARAPKDIRMGEVIRLTESSFAVVECLNPETSQCAIHGPCGLRPWLAKATDAFLRTLDTVTLDEVTKKRTDLRKALGRSR